jgi:hypothetical protein
MRLSADPCPRSQRSVTAGRALGGLFVVAILAACGGGGSTAATTTTSAPATITRADFIRQANAICQVMNDKVHAVPDPGSDPDKVADALQLDIAVTSDAFQQLQGLPMPAGDERVIEDIYSKINLLLSDGADLSASVRNRDRAKVLTLQATVKADTTAANNASNAYGLTVCGS